MVGDALEETKESFPDSTASITPLIMTLCCGNLTLMRIGYLKPLGSSLSSSESLMAKPAHSLTRTFLRLKLLLLLVTGAGAGLGWEGAGSSPISTPSLIISPVAALHNAKCCGDSNVECGIPQVLFDCLDRESGPIRPVIPAHNSIMSSSSKFCAVQFLLNGLDSKSCWDWGRGSSRR